MRSTRPLRSSAVLLTVLCAAAAPCAPAASPSSRAPGPGSDRRLLREEYDGIVHALPEPGKEPLDPFVDRVWTVAEKWILAYLDEHPPTSATDLAADVKGLRRDLPPTVDAKGDALDAGALRLATGPQAAYAVALHWNWEGDLYGTVLIVARSSGGGYRVAWRIRDAAANEMTKKGELDRWNFYEPVAHDGPLDGDLLRLPDTASGRPRFCVHAVTNPAMGLNCPAQISVWEWTGATAIPELVAMYDAAGRSEVALHGDTLRVRTNAALSCFYPCGTCVGPQSTWSLRVAPTRVEDRGHVPDVPELRAFDAVLERVAEGKDASDLASKGAIAYLASQYADLRRKYGRERKQADCSVGMIMSWKVRREATRSALDVWVDEFYPLTVYLEPRNGRPFITRIVEHPEDP